MSEQSDLKNYFGKRNAETDQEPSSSSWSESVKSESSQKPVLKKDRKFLSIWFSVYPRNKKGHGNIIKKGHFKHALSDQKGHSKRALIDQKGHINFGISVVA